LGVRRVHQRADSTVVEVLVSGEQRGRDVVFKVQRAHPAGERARLEFDVLSLLSERFAGCPSYGVPLPLGLDETVAAVMMEPCRGRPLDTLVREARASCAPGRRIALESALRRTGGWLRMFQAQTERQAEGGRALEVLLARARADLHACTGRALAPPSAARIAERLDGLAARVAGEPLRVVGRQGDFWPGNVYAGDDRVEVIDFEGFGEGLPYEDPAYFLLQLELFYAYPGLRRPFAGLGRAFLEGYLEAEALDRPAWELCRLAKGLQMLAQDVARVRARGPRRRWRRHVLRTQVDEAAS
jgi:aminoglycoside phosphotransferase (APT) family kinase protein